MLRVGYNRSYWFFERWFKGFASKEFKNLTVNLYFNGLDQLLSCNYLSGICVSTDDEDAYELSKKHGCIDIGIRSAELSNSSASKFSYGKIQQKDF